MKTVKKFNDHSVVVRGAATVYRCVCFLFERLGENELCRRLKNGEPLLAI